MLQSLAGRGFPEFSQQCNYQMIQETKTPLNLHQIPGHIAVMTAASNMPYLMTFSEGTAAGAILFSSNASLTSSVNFPRTSK